MMANDGPLFYHCLQAILIIPLIASCHMLPDVMSPVPRVDPWLQVAPQQR